MQNFSFPTSISFGAGVVSRLPDYLRQNGLNRPLIVTDPIVQQLPFFKTIVDKLNLKGFSFSVFSDIRKNPVKADVLKGKAAFEDECDSIIGLGGGSALDVSRAVALSINHDRDLFDYDDLAGGSNLISQPIPHFITIPTTAGTGSEVGRSAIISEDESKRKRILFHPTLMARFVFADPELTYGLPPEVTAATGMDALAHHMEAFLAKGYNPMCDGIALEGIRMIWNALERAVHHPDPASRSEMMLASLMGAVAFQKGLGIVHAMSHPLSTLMDMHHGLANAVNLPYGLQYNQQGLDDRFYRMAQQMHLKDGEDIPKALLDFNHRLNLPVNLSQCGIKVENLPELTELAVADFCLPLNPRPAGYQDILSIYQKALG
jgi:alcohol dehydrogenase class IV